MASLSRSGPWHIRLAVLAAFVWSNGVARAQPVPDGQNPLAKAMFYGVDACMKCHEEPGKFSNDRSLVRLDEYAVWKTQDKHSLAFAVLKGKRGQTMGKHLKIADVTRDDRCLNCHAVNVPVDRRFSEKDDPVRLA